MGGDNGNREKGALSHQDTDDDGDSRCHLPNLLIRLHDLLDPCLNGEGEKGGATS